MFHSANNPPNHLLQTAPKIGVGLRHPHYQEALGGTSAIDFVELHTENFFAAGGATRQFLVQLAQRYPISLHGTAAGLGSAIGVNPSYLNKWQQLVEQINPWLLSEHACFTWSHWNQKPVHASDLLPLELTETNLQVMVNNIDLVQQRLGRPLLIENLSSYLPPVPEEMSEVEFLLALVDRTQCGLLLDLNNILVNAHNFSDRPALEVAKQWLAAVPASAVGEIHLAGSTAVAPGELLIDDHAQPVSEQGWQLYRYAISRFGAKPTLVEWDNNLPQWQELLQQADRARAIANEVTVAVKGGSQ